jgi:hypothetical protein
MNWLQQVFPLSNPKYFRLGPDPKIVMGRWNKESLPYQGVNERGVISLLLPIAYCLFSVFLEGCSLFSLSTPFFSHLPYLN